MGMKGGSLCQKKIDSRDGCRTRLTIYKIEGNMEILFIRHGKPDYSLADEKKLKYLEKNFCPLDKNVINDIINVSKKTELKNAELILSSPYTRALQTAEIINRELKIPLLVEYDLHEWMVDLNNSYISEAETLIRYREFQDNKGIHPKNKNKKWEDILSIKKRAIPVLNKYTNYSKIIVVSHGVLIQSLLEKKMNIPLCGIVKYIYK